jgi:hypothetical protein
MSHSGNETCNTRTQVYGSLLCVCYRSYSEIRYCLHCLGILSIELDFPIENSKLLQLLVEERMKVERPIPGGSTKEFSMSLGVRVARRREPTTPLYHLDLPSVSPRLTLQKE